MKKQREKGKEFSLAVLKLVGGIFGLIIFISLGKYLLFGIVDSMMVYGTAAVLVTIQSPAFLLAICFIGTICCIGFIYDFFSHPIKMKRCKKRFEQIEKIPVKITRITKKNPRKDCDIYQAYRVEWNFIREMIHGIPMHTIIYTDEPEFMYAYRGKEVYLEYNPKYYHCYELKFLEK